MYTALEANKGLAAWKSPVFCHMILKSQYLIGCNI